MRCCNPNHLPSWFVGEGVQLWNEWIILGQIPFIGIPSPNIRDIAEVRRVEIQPHARIWILKVRSISNIILWLLKDCCGNVSSCRVNITNLYHTVCYPMAKYLVTKVWEAIRTSLDMRCNRKDLKKVPRACFDDHGKVQYQVCLWRLGFELSPEQELTPQENDGISKATQKCNPGVSLNTWTVSFLLPKGAE